MPDGKFTPIGSEPAYKSEFFQQLTGQPPAVAAPPAEDEIPDWLKAQGLKPIAQTNAPKTPAQTPAGEADLPDWLKELGLDSIAPTDAPKTPAQTPAAETNALPNWLVNIGPESTAPTSAALVPPAAEAVPKMSLANLLEAKKQESAAAAKAAQEAAAKAAAATPPIEETSSEHSLANLLEIKKQELAAAKAAAEELPVVEVQVEEAQPAQDVALTVVEEPALEVPAEETPEVVPAPAVPEDAAALGLDAQPAEPQTVPVEELPAEEVSASELAIALPLDQRGEDVVPDSVESPTVANPDLEAAALTASAIPESHVVTPKPAEYKWGKFSVEQQLRRLGFGDIDFKPGKGKISKITGFLQTLRRLELADVDPGQSIGLVTPALKESGIRGKIKLFLAEQAIDGIKLKENKPLLDSAANSLLDQFRREEAQTHYGRLVKRIRELSGDDPQALADIMRTVQSTEEFHTRLGIQPETAVYLQAEAKRNPDVAKALTSYIAASEIIERRYWGEQIRDEVVEHLALATRSLVDIGDKASIGGIRIIADAAKIRQTTRAFELYKEAVMTADPDAIISFGEKDEMTITTASGRTFDVKKSDIAALAGMEIDGSFDPQALVHDLHDIVNHVLEQSIALIDQIQGRKFSIEGTKREMESNILTERKSRISRIRAKHREVIKSAEAEIRSNEQKKASVEKKISGINDKTKGVSKPRATAILKSYSLELTESKEESFTLTETITAQQAVLAQKRETLEAKIKLEIESTVDTWESSQRIQNAAEIARMNADTRKMTPAQLEAYHQGRLKHVIIEADITAGELEKWSRLATPEGRAESVGRLARIVLDGEMNEASLRLQLSNIKENDKVSKDRKAELRALIHQSQTDSKAALAQERSSLLPDLTVTDNPQTEIFIMLEQAVFGAEYALPIETSEGNLASETKIMVKRGLYDLLSMSTMDEEIQIKVAELRQKASAEAESGSASKVGAEQTAS